MDLGGGKGAALIHKDGLIRVGRLAGQGPVPSP